MRLSSSGGFAAGLVKGPATEHGVQDVDAEAGEQSQSRKRARLARRGRLVELN